MIARAEFTGTRPTEKTSPELYTVPQSPEAECAVLGGLIFSAYDDSIHEIIPLLRPELFFSQTNRLVFEVIADLYVKGIRADALLVRNELSRRGQLDMIGGAGYLADLGEHTPGAINAEHYARIVRDKAMLRSLIQTADNLRDMAFDPAGDAGEIIEQAEQSILAATNEVVRSETVKSSDITLGVVDEVLNRREGQLAGLPTGFAELDLLTHGCKPGELTVIAARPSMGKTAMALNIAEHVAVNKNVPSAIFSLEMTDSQLIERMLSSRAGVDIHALASGCVSQEAEQAIRIAGQEISSAPLFIESCRDDLTHLTLRTKARRLVRQHNVGLLIVDYLQLIHPPANGQRRDRYAEVGAISAAMKSLSLELDIPIIALSQLNRLSEQREGNRPRLSDLRESGNIEQDADVVMLLHRAIHDKEAKPDAAELIIAKHRNGPTGSINLKWSGQLARFENQPQFGDNS